MSARLYESENLRNFSKNPFLVYRSSEFIEQVYAYEELNEAIKQLKNQFDAFKIISACGFAVDLNLSFDGVALLIGILDNGCHFCPVPKDTAKHFLVNCSVSYLISRDDSIAKKFKGIDYLGEVNMTKETYKLYLVNDNSEKQKHLPKNMIYTISTTGTTGEPKMVHVPYDCLAPNITSLSCKFELNSQDVIYLGTPFTFDPFVVEIFMALATGATLLLTCEENRLNIENLLQILWPKDETRLAATILQMTPTNFRQFGLVDIKQKILALDSKLRVLVLGGEEFPSRHELLTWLPDNFENHIRIFNIYGITELSCWSTMYEWNCNTDFDLAPLGLPLDDETFLRIVSTVDGEDISTCGKGELYVGSATRKTFMSQIDDIGIINNPLHVLYRSTGDLVERNSNGDIFYVGRLNEIVKRMGKRVCLTGIEQRLGAKLSTYGYVRTFFLWHESKQILICCIHVETEEFTTAIKSVIMNNLAEHEKPDRIVMVKKLPLNKHNKLDRKILLEMALNYAESALLPIQKFHHFLKEVLQLNTNADFNSTLTTKRIKLETENNEMLKSFTAAGGSSYQALSLATEIGETLADSNDQRILLKMLLDTNSKIFDICKFLQNSAIKENFLFETKNTSAIEHSKRKLKMLWRVNMEKCIDANAALCENDESICIGSHAGLLLNIRTSTGKVLSCFRLRDRIECQVTYASAKIGLVGCDAGYLYCLDFADNQIKWTLYIGSQVKAKPLVIDRNFAIIGCYDTEFNLAAVCLEKAKIEWRKKIGTRPIFAAPILLGSCHALICALDGTYVCLDFRSSQTIWTRKCDSPIFSTPKTIGNGNEFLMAEVEGKLHLCRSETGDIVSN